MKKVKYRVEINYLFHEYEDCALSTSAPYYNEAEAEAAYIAAQEERCADVKNAPARVKLLKYTSDGLQEVKRNY